MPTGSEPARDDVAWQQILPVPPNRATLASAPVESNRIDDDELTDRDRDSEDLRRRRIDTHVRELAEKIAVTWEVWDSEAVIFEYGPAVVAAVHARLSNLEESGRLDIRSSRSGYFLSSLRQLAKTIKKRREFPPEEYSQPKREVPPNSTSSDIPDEGSDEYYAWYLERQRERGTR